MRLYATENGSSLSHHGIRGQKWGVRRYQNEDGSLTSAGKKRYDVNNASDRKKLSKQYSDYSKKAQALCDEYGMAEWDDLAKENTRDEAEVLKKYGLK